MRQVTVLVVLTLVVTGGAGAGEQGPGAVEPAPQPPAASDPGVERLMAELVAAPVIPDSSEAYTPPPCQGLFPDVPCSSGFAPWIEQLYRDQITSGCGGGLYCPDSPVTRAQMAVFLEKTGRGTDRWPPNVVNVSVVVSQTGIPDSVASGQALLDAIAAIPGTAPQAPSGDNPTVVRIGPGTYQLAGARLELPGYVYLHGSGRYVTRISSVADSPEAVRVTGPTEIRDLSIEIVPQVGPAIGLVVEANNSLRLIDADLYANGASTVGTGLLTGDSFVTVERSRITGVLLGGTGYAVFVLGAGAQSVEIIDSVLWGSTNAVYNNSGGYVKLNNTMTASGSLYKGASASYRCRLVHNNLYATVTCP